MNNSDNMKQNLSFNTAFIAMIACTLALFTACEKHDGTEYFKSKCTAELNGQTYIDQLPLIYILSPAASMTPSFSYDGNSALFETNLCKERGGTPLYYVSIHLFVSTPEEFLDKEQNIEKKDIDYPDDKPTNWDYVRYCEENQVSYARVNGELINKGTFKITSYNKEKGEYKGIFTLTFSEGTLKGEFSL